MRSVARMCCLLGLSSAAMLFVAGCGVTSPEICVYVVRPDGTGDYATIQDAIDQADDGAIIELTEGVFRGDGNRDIYVRGTSSIVVRSRSGNPRTCVMNLEGASGEEHYGFKFWQNQTPLSVLEGITIANGYHSDAGAAVQVGLWLPVEIRNCIFLANTSEGGLYSNSSGGAIRTRDESSTTIAECIFIGNQAAANGGAVSCGGEVSFIDCVFADNSAGESGGAVACSNSAEFIGCTMVSNSASSGSGVYCWQGSDAHLKRTIIASGLQGEAIAAGDLVPPDIACCDFYSNSGGDWVGPTAGLLGVEGNISADPIFCDAAAHDFSLEIGSPCTEESTDCGLIGACAVGCVDWSRRAGLSDDTELR